MGSRCRRFGHEFTPWSLWRAVFQQIEPPMSVLDDVPTTDKTPPKERDRQCIHCSLIEYEDQDGQLHPRTIRDSAPAGTAG